MKLVLIFGSGAVGKMTVGQELAKQTNYRLFHNHVMIEPVIETLGYYDATLVTELRMTLFKYVVKTNLEGLIFTCIWAFDEPSDWTTIQKVVELFDETYYIELIADQETRLKRNESSNRIKHKPSKRDINFSKQLILREDSKYRLVSHEGELTFKNYLRIDNTDKEPEVVASLIKERFRL
ncbi:MAG TPA: AAA family ATPase [Erysipelothrix sp.]|jgi:hypothetical protein|nr:AAA family ATPase [Erysipelothrix sp.]